MLRRRLYAMTKNARPHRAAAPPTAPTVAPAMPPFEMELELVSDWAVDVDDGEALELETVFLFLNRLAMSVLPNPFSGFVTVAPPVLLGKYSISDEKHKIRKTCERSKIHIPSPNNIGNVLMYFVLPVIRVIIKKPVVLIEIKNSYPVLERATVTGGWFGFKLLTAMWNKPSNSQHGVFSCKLALVLDSEVITIYDPDPAKRWQGKDVDIAVGCGS